MPAEIAAEKHPRVRNVVLITIDSLRADQPWTGYDRFSTPHLSALAERSLVYTRAYSLANLTTASLNSMLASRYPSELVRDGCTIGRYSIPGSLAPTLQAAHIETVAAHGHAIFVGYTAPSAGFGRWDLVRGAAGLLQTRGAVTGRDIADLMVRSLPSKGSTKSRFSWGHFVDPHDEYVEHREHPSRTEGVRSRYDSEVGFTDAVVGRVLQALTDRGVAQSTAILVTSDHGEAFGEHGNNKHGFSLFEEEVRVPLLLHIPGVDPKRIAEPRSLIDVAPTIAELLGVTIPADWRGKSLLRDLAHPLGEDSPVIIDVPSMQARVAMQAVIRGNVKVVFSAGVPAVYDLHQDPTEQASLSGEHAERAVKLAQQTLDSLQSIPSPKCTVGAKALAVPETL